MFTGENWDPYEWAKVFKKSGAKFVVLVAEHHDGFALWESNYTRWCATKIGPKRDIVRELKEAVEGQGLIFGISYHRAEHWWFFDQGMKIESDVKDPRYLDLYGPAQSASLNPRDPPSLDNVQPNDEFLMDWLLRIVEAVEKYRPWLVYFDWWIANPSFQPYLKAFASYYYNRSYKWGIEPVIIYKQGAFGEGTAIPDLAERGTIKNVYPSTWLADTSIDYKSWGYIKDAEYKLPSVILSHLGDVVSKNGVFLLNIGPKADGTIPEEAKRILLDVGDWLNVNGEAIFGSKPWRVYGEGPSGINEGGFFTERKITLGYQDVRYTVKDYYPRQRHIYAILFGKPKEITLRSFMKNLKLIEEAVIVDVSRLDGKGKLEWSLSDEGLKIKIEEVIRAPLVIRVILDYR